MKYNNYDYIDGTEDFNDMHRFLKEIYALTNKPQIWEFVRLEFWKFASVVFNSDPNFLSKNAQLWRDGQGKLRGIFICEEGGDYFSVVVHPECPELADEIYSFAKDVWGKDKEKLTTDALLHSTELPAIIRAGFKEEKHSGNTRRYELENMKLEPVLEEGFSIKHITEAPDYVGKWQTICISYNPDADLKANLIIGERIFQVILKSWIYQLFLQKESMLPFAMVLLTKRILRR